MCLLLNIWIITDTWADQHTKAMRTTMDASIIGCTFVPRYIIWFAACKSARLMIVAVHVCIVDVLLRMIYFDVDNMDTESRLQKKNQGMMDALQL
jgi:hypothetical protein